MSAIKLKLPRAEGLELAAAKFKLSLVLFLFLVTFGNPVFGQDMQPSFSPKAWKKLLTRYVAYDLPMPPSDAKLTLHTKKAGTVNGVPMIYNYLGFILKPGSEPGKSIVLFGTSKLQVGDDELKTVVPGPNTSFEINRINHWNGAYSTNELFATAIQCKARGWDKLAEALLEKSLDGSVGDGIFTQPANVTAEEALSYLVLTHWANQVLKPRPDRAKIIKHLEALFTEKPDLATGRQAFLSSLKAAAVPNHTKPGSVESLIWDLADVPESSAQENNESDPGARIARLGFAAVPALLDHIDDARLTGSVRHRVMNSPPANLLVQDVVAELLTTLAGREEARHWRHRAPLDDRLSWPLERQDVIAWWQRTKHVSEEAYLADHVLSDDPTPAGLNRSNLELLAKKYPQRLERIYRIILNTRPQLGLWEVAHAIANSSLPKDKKIELLLLGATHQNLDHQIAALDGLSGVDQKRFVTLLTKILDGLPGRSNTDYWMCPEARLAQLATLTDDPHAWEARERLAKRSVVGLRMEMINDTHSDLKQHRAQRLTFLAAFLGDVDLRDADKDAKIPNGPYAGWGFPQMEVRNFATLQIASMVSIEIETEFGKDLRPEQWVMLRKLVRGALAREGIDIPKSVTQTEK